jgi:aspartate racemase
MKTIGLIAGMSWESSVTYYELLNKKTKEMLGGFHSCKCLIYSVDFAEIEKLQHDDDWKELDAMMADAALRLEKAGAELIILCTNTMHLCTPAIKANITIPFLHIAEAAGEEMVKHNMKKVGLLGTKFTMEKDFYKALIKERYGIEVIVPDESERNAVHKIIYGELVQGIVSNESREIFKSIIKTLVLKGAQGVILGCTEIPLLISDKDVNIPTFNTTKIHAEKAVERALAFD